MKIKIKDNTFESQSLQGKIFEWNHKGYFGDSPQLCQVVRVGQDDEFVLVHLNTGNRMGIEQQPYAQIYQRIMQDDMRQLEDDETIEISLQ
jgi:hypothetical protein